MGRKREDLPMSTPNPVSTNRAHWEELAAIHGQDGYYDSRALVDGADSLTAEEQAAIELAVGGVDGLDVLHVQCHIGFDTISLARRGAQVTGADFSGAALAKAAALAAAAGVDARWVEADAMDLPSSLAESFDLAYATVGVLCWIPDVARWMTSVASVLRPGGRLVLIDTHPLLNMVGDDLPLHLDFPYRDQGPIPFDEPGSYAVPEADVNARATVQFCHSLGEIVNAAIAAGLQIETLTEHLEARRAPRDHVLERGADGLLRLSLNSQQLPILFTLVASRL